MTDKKADKTKRQMNKTEIKKSKDGWASIWIGGTDVGATARKAAANLILNERPFIIDPHKFN